MGGNLQIQTKGGPETTMTKIFWHVIVEPPKLKEDLRQRIKTDQANNSLRADNFKNESEAIRTLVSWYLAIREKGLFLRDINEMLLSSKEGLENNDKKFPFSFKEKSHSIDSSLVIVK